MQCSLLFRRSCIFISPNILSHINVSRTDSKGMKNTSKMSTGKLYQISVTCQLGKFKLGWGKFKLGGKEHMLFIEEDRMTFRPGYIGTRILVTQLIYWDKDTIHLF